MTETKTKKRKRDFEDITPTPQKMLKSEQKYEPMELSPFETLTEDVVEKQMFPFLSNEDLAQLSKSSKYEQNLTETKRGLRFAQQEAEKARIVKEIERIAQIMEIEAPNQDEVAKIINDVWKIPFDKYTWNRPGIIIPITSPFDDDHVDLIQKLFTRRDLESLTETSIFEREHTRVTKVMWIMGSPKLTPHEKKSLIKQFFTSLDNSARGFNLQLSSTRKKIELWRHITKFLLRTGDWKQSQTFLPEFEKFLSEYNQYKEEPKNRDLNFWTISIDFNHFLKMYGSTKRVL